MSSSANRALVRLFARSPRLSLSTSQQHARVLLPPPMSIYLTPRW